MKNTWPCTLLLLALTALAGCDFNATSDGKTKTGSCLLNNYGYAKFRNESPSKATLFIYWDGTYQGSVKYGETQPQEGMATKSGSHELSFRFNEVDIACGPQTVDIDRCSSDTFTCSN